MPVGGRVWVFELERVRCNVDKTTDASSGSLARDVCVSLLAEFAVVTVESMVEFDPVDALVVFSGFPRTAVLVMGHVVSLESAEEVTDDMGCFVVNRPVVSAKVVVPFVCNGSYSVKGSSMLRGNDTVVGQDARIGRKSGKGPFVVSLLREINCPMQATTC